MTTALIGLYYLLIERTSDKTMKPQYYMPYECGFNMLGGIVFFGFTKVVEIKPKMSGLVVSCTEISLFICAQE